RLIAELVIGELLELVLERVHGLHGLLEPAQDASFARAQQLLERIGHRCLPWVRVPTGDRRAYRAMLPARDLPRLCPRIAGHDAEREQTCGRVLAGIPSSRYAYTQKRNTG